MEERKRLIKQTRGGMNRLGAIMIVYYLIMNVAVIITMLADACVYLFGSLVKGSAVTVDSLAEHLLQTATSNGWGYLLAIVAGCVILLLWRGKGFFREIFIREKKMAAGVFFAMLSMFLLPQVLLQLYAPALEWLLNQMGFSAMAALEMATIATDSFSMFVYISFLGPLAEELLFRGVLLRLLRPCGKQAAILFSAILFGLFHGNVIQIPFAFLVGLVLGYVTVEYSIVWAIILHVFNNFVMSDLLGKLAEYYPDLAGILSWVILGGAAAAAVVLLIVKRKETAAFFRENKVEKLTWKGALTSPVMWIFTVMMLLSSLLTITRI